MRNETGTVDITLGEQKFDTTYQKKIYETLDDVYQESHADGGKAILKKLNMAEDWERRTKARNDFLKDGEAAKAKAFEDNVKAYINALQKSGKAVNEAKVRARVAAMMEEDL
jgi:hypothetical protein